MFDQAARLRALLAGPDFLVMPCCFDAFSARLIERAGFPLSFMSGFSVSAARLGLPDTGLISYGEMVAQGEAICSAVDIPIFGDGDTGYGNAINVKRTVEGYARAGFAGIMIEDQIAPKRCGHTRGKQVVDFDDALMRVRAAVDARAALRERGGDMVILARTDARQTHGLDEAIRRMDAMRALGADVLFLEAPESETEMRRFCDAVDGVKMANLVEQGKTPVLPPDTLAEIGYTIAAHPLTLMLAAQAAMEAALQDLAAGQVPKNLASFEALQAAVGFPDYYQEEERYADRTKP